MGTMKQILWSGRRVQALRLSLYGDGYGSVKRFADRLDVSRQTVYRMEERGVRWKRVAGQLDQLEREAARV